MPTNKIQKASASFGVARQDGGIIIAVRPNHDTITALRGVQFAFELLNGITLEQAKKVVDMLNENFIGLLAATASEEKVDDKSQAASG
jgi:hypothetical protein